VKREVALREGAWKETAELVTFGTLKLTDRLISTSTLKENLARKHQIYDDNYFLMES
jgi:hypothetical protein